MSVYCYLRVSTDNQDVDSQRIGIREFCEKHGWEIDGWTEDEGVSGAIDPRKRNLHKMLVKAKPGDCLIFSEISRIGRKLDMILDFIREASERNLKIYTVKDRYVLEDTIQSKVLVTVMGLAAEIERDLLRQRTKEGLKRAIAAGKKLGRPFGVLNQHNVLDGKETTVAEMLKAGCSLGMIANRCKCHRQSVRNWMSKDRNRDALLALGVPTVCFEKQARKPIQVKKREERNTIYSKYKDKVAFMYFELRKTKKEIAEWIRMGGLKCTAQALGRTMCKIWRMDGTEILPQYREMLERRRRPQGDGEPGTAAKCG